MVNKIENIQNEFYWFMQHTSDFIILLNEAGKILEINEPAILFHNFKHSSLIGSDYFELLNKIHLNFPILSLEQLEKANVPLSIETENFINGNNYKIRWSITKILKSQNTISYILHGVSKNLMNKNILNQAANDNKRLNFLTNFNKELMGISSTQYITVEDYVISIQECFENIIASMPGNVYWMDTNSILLGCNNNVVQMLGLKNKNEIIGKNYEEISKLIPIDIQEQIKFFHQCDLEVIATGIAKLNIEEPPFLDIKGKVVNFLTHRVPIKDKTDKVIGVIGISFDITERKIKEQKLLDAKSTAEADNFAKNELLTQLSQEIMGNVFIENDNIKNNVETIRHYYQSIIGCMPNNVYWWDTNSVIRGCNENVAKLLGFKSNEEVIGMTYEEMAIRSGWDEGQGEFFKQSDLEVMRTGKGKFNIEEPPIADPQGNMIYFLTSRVPIKNKNNEVTGVIGISIDITERKKMEEELRQAKEAAEAANQAKTDFIANMSHDIRTPLTGVIGVSRMLYEHTSDAKDKEYAEWIHASGYQLLTLLNGVLDVLTADNAKEDDLQLETFDIRKSIDSVAKLELPTVKTKHLDLKIEIDERVPHCIISDKTKLHRILLNLLGNAIKFTEKGYVGIGIKLLELKNQQVTLRFEVMDSGIGIPADLQEKVFDRFFRVSPSYKGKYRGHGVGLHIVQRYVTLLGGEPVQLTSQLGKGTTFFFELTFNLGDAKDIKPESNDHELEQEPPLAIKPAQPSVIEPAEDNELDESLPHFLVVEDNFAALKVVENLVKQVGCRFTSTTDGLQALELAKTTNFDLVLTDIGLPGLTGTELSSEIRTWEKAHHKKRIPIVALTGHAVGEAEHECLQAGIDKVLTKPATLNAIQALVEQFQLANQYDLLSVATSSKQQQSAGLLGHDLPDNEQELFNLNQYPLFDTANGIASAGSEDVLKTLLHVLVNNTIPEDETAIIQAHDEQNWQRIEHIAHRMKSGALYCGTIRFRYACQYLERYRKAGHTQLQENLYQQLLTVVAETKHFLEQWLKQQHG